MRLRAGDEPTQLRHARATIGAGPQPIPDRGEILTAVGDRAVDRIAANTEACAHRGAGIQARILGSAGKNASTLGRRQAWLVEQ